MRNFAASSTKLKLKVMAAVGGGGRGGGFGAGGAGGGGKEGGGGGGDDPYGGLSESEWLKKKLEAKEAEAAELKKELAETAAQDKYEQQVKRKQTRHNQRKD